MNIMKNVYYSCITNCSRHWITHVEETVPFPALGKLTFYRKVGKVLVDKLPNHYLYKSNGLFGD